MIDNQKNELRKSMRLEIKGLSMSERQVASKTIVGELVNLIHSLNPKVTIIASFCGLKIEPDLSDLHSKLPQAKIVYPLCKSENELDFYHVDKPDEQLKKGYYGLYEPDPEFCEKVEVADIGLFLIPAFAYTRDGRRLGKGGGYYDRALSKAESSVMTIGVAFKCQLLEDLPTDNNDVIIDRVVAL